MTPEDKAEALRYQLGDRLFAAVAGDSARILAALSVASTLINRRDPEFARLWFAAPCDELGGRTPIELLATALGDDLERATAVLLVAVRSI